MARNKKFILTDYFDLKDVRPASLRENNLVTFDYNSPDGVHDRNPLTLIVGKERDRCYGWNLHYDMKEFQDIVDKTYESVNKILENEWYRKYPGKKQELREKRKVFDKSLIEVVDLKNMARRVPKNLIELFEVYRENDAIFRCYLFQRMNKVSKLTWKV